MFGAAIASCLHDNNNTDDVDERGGSGWNVRTNFTFQAETSDYT